MGGSLARALRPQVAHLTGIDTDAATRRAALQAGVAHAALPDLAGVRWRPGDLVVLATPVQTLLTQLRDLPRLAGGGCQVLDLGSTKAEIVAAMDALPPAFAAVGGHPICGREVSGWETGSADLFRAQTFVLCPSARTTPALRELASELVTALGATPLWLEAEAHDRIVALTSHLPYVLSALLMQQAAATAQANSPVWAVSGGGLRDMTRLAGSSPAMLRDILLTNRTAVVAEIGRFLADLQQFQNLLQTADADALVAWLQAAYDQRQAYWRAKWEK